jgi:hypothetical protein
MKNDDKIMVSLRLHKELYNYVKLCSEKEFTTLSGYLTRLILNDKNKNQKK